MSSPGSAFVRATALARTLLAFCALVAAGTPGAQADPLPAWHDGAVKARIVAFVRAVTDPASRDFVRPADRIAVFDNDGTLWSEQPIYVQLQFAVDRVKALAPQHPAWRTTQPFAAALAGDLEGLAASGEKGVVELLMATHAGMTSEQFADTVREWLATARHPKLGRPYTDLVFQPMLELLAYLRASGFRTWIVSGGGIEFLRVFAEESYGIPPEQVIGSSIRTRYEVRDGQPAIVRLPEVDFVDDRAGKPVGIHKFVGRRPIAAFGNSDGDFEMLEWVSSGSGARLALLVHHDDAEREFAYDRKSAFGRLDRGLDEAAKRGWVLASMKNDWRTVFAPAKGPR